MSEKGRRSACLAQTAFVRVNQVGYPANASKRAYLVTSATETGATFKLTNSSGTPVFNAAIGVKLGSWGSFSNVYALDFDGVTTPGTYTITVTGPASATSPGFLIDVPANVYSTPLANSLYFYQNERDGANFIPTPLRSAGGHLNPTGKPHGAPSGEHHAGDLPALRADAAGNATIDSRVRGLAGGPTEFAGKALVVHLSPDDYATQPTGNSGARIACGVIAATPPRDAGGQVIPPPRDM